MSSSVPPTLEGTSAFVRDRFLVGDVTALVNITAGTAVVVAAGSSSCVVASISGTQVLYGVALINANAGQKITVITRGLARATAQNAMNAGDLVGPAPSGYVASLTLGALSGICTPSIPRGICIVGTATSGSTVLVDLF